MKPLTKKQRHILLSCAVVPRAALLPLNKPDLKTCLALFHLGLLEPAGQNPGEPTMWRISKLGHLHANQLRRTEPRP